MSNVIAFRPRARTEPQDKKDEPCSILIFSGVRFERLGDRDDNGGGARKGDASVGGFAREA